MQELIELDHELFLFLNNLGDPAWDCFWLAITDKFTGIPLYILFLYLIFRNFGWKGTLASMVIITLLITATDQLANVFKDGFERLRPCRQEGVMEQARFVAVRCGRFGYFSAHASNSMGVAVFLVLLFRKIYPKWIYLVLIWPLLSSYSRIYLGVHYPADVITGLLIGAILGYLFYKLLQYIFLKLNLSQA
ncbi:phosphatase PAP2 family protein [Autumnicola psychrophila]|uniref:Phosphatase PAP2 family protein n=1 Tax=Autumnicola psychrophila TaxID=3075592 RepID=A0ABU3DT57_9FLAO|nr:phosphatase PAP2 family protein [Zunongwangia sp. F225]MDT0686887.1 phosphatase PAP2 family protein [Zunongwangia sp. F225]